VQHLDPDLAALQEVRDCVARAKRAVEAVARHDQARTDALCAAMAVAAESAAFDLARVAVEETGIGRVHYKVLKNLFGSRGVWESIKDERSVGVIARDERRGVVEVATPVGVVAGIIPTTNPTSTAIAKALIAVKGRNAIVLSPHPRSKRCIGETVEVLRRAIERTGGPPDLVTTLSNPTIESTGALMKHRDVAIILATGGSGLVHAAYSSGKPAYGVGPGNVPCYVDRSADLARTAKILVGSQSFDNGTLCCSEQALVLDRPIAERFLTEMQARGAHVCSPEETKKLERHCNKRGHMNPDVVGLDPWKIAEAAGFSVPRETSVLLAHQGGVGPDWPLSIEILAPLLSVHLVDGWEEGCKVSIEVLNYGGLGHTIGLHATDQAVIDAWMLEKPANRILVNGPCSQGAVGYSTHLVPSMSLGCGPQAGNITSDNITARHLLNIKRVGFLRMDWDALEQRDHAFAARFTHEAAPRGSGLQGDPALRGPRPAAQAPAAAPSTADVTSNWRGNPAVVLPTARAQVPPFQESVRAAPTFTRPTPPPASAAKVAPAPKAPGSGAETAVLPPPRAAAAPPAPTAKPAQSPYVGAGLTPAEIQDIMAHAGRGCPLGPCKGCPHSNVNTGACMA
jgi:acyl-CoA reductase-like NAD-dependent aldehyde dehydrogenase